MEMSLFLGQLFGLYLIVMGLFMLLRRRKMHALTQDFVKSPALITFAGSIALLIGLWVLLIHPVFEWSWRGLITLLFGIVPILRGIFRIFFMRPEMKFVSKCYKGNGPVYMGIIAVLIGLYLAWHGFGL